MGRSRKQRKAARGDENGGGGYDSLYSLPSETRWLDGNPNMAGNMNDKVELEGSRVRVCDLKLNPVEKRMLFSPNSMASKTRSKKLNRTRLSKQAQKAASFNVNGYESD